MDVDSLHKAPVVEDPIGRLHAAAETCSPIALLAEAPAGQQQQG